MSAQPPAAHLPVEGVHVERQEIKVWVVQHPVEVLTCGTMTVIVSHPTTLAYSPHCCPKQHGHPVAWCAHAAVYCAAGVLVLRTLQARVHPAKGSKL